MRVPLHVVEKRRNQLAQLIRQRSYLPIHEVCRELGISEATARRDLSALQTQKRVTRTLGGALGSYNQMFVPFSARRSIAADAKRRIAQLARQQIVPGSVCFFDAGTTILALAQELHEGPATPLRIVTNSLPTAETLGTLDSVEVELLGGQYLANQSVLLGRNARRALDFHKIDIAFLSAEAMDTAGLWNTQADVVAFQQSVIARAEHVVLCVDSTKLGTSAGAFLGPWDEIDLLITDASLATLKQAKLPIQRFQILNH